MACGGRLAGVRLMARRVQWGGEAVSLEARPDPAGDGQLVVAIGDQTARVRAESAPDGSLRLHLLDEGRTIRAVVSAVGGDRWVTIGADTWVLHEASHDGEHADADHDLEAPMPGKVLAVEVAPGDEVAQGQVLVIVEAMKMEHAIKAPRAATIAHVAAEVGAMVSPGTALVSFCDDEASA